MEVDATLRSPRFYCSLQRLAPVAFFLILGVFTVVYHHITPFLPHGWDLTASGSTGVTGLLLDSPGLHNAGEAIHVDQAEFEDGVIRSASATVDGEDDAISADGDARTQTRRDPRVAICLVGGARAFELTGPTIKKFVLDVYDGADVFLHSPLDKDSHKFTMLHGTKNLAAARIFRPRAIPTSRVPEGLLTASNSPHGVQGLVQYFSLVEGCITMIKQYEGRQNMSYDWIVRTRLDTFWNAPAPPLSSFSKEVYTVPYGSQFGGLNDRFGIGTWRTSQVALARLSLLPLIRSEGYTYLNSEKAFKLQLLVSNVSFQLRQLPFCVLSRRRYAWPPAEHGVPVASILSGGPLNGAKCRPCSPKLTGSRAKVVSDRLSRAWGWIGPVDDVQLCDATNDWGSEWEAVYNQTVGADADLTQRRLSLSSRSLETCIEDLEAVKADWASWEAPPSRDICAAAVQ